MFKFDARKLGNKELFIKLREMLATERGKEVYIELLVNSHNSVRSVNAFVSMAGCRTEIKEKEGYYVVVIRGIPCCT